MRDARGTEPAIESVRRRAMHDFVYSGLSSKRIKLVLVQSDAHTMMYARNLVKNYLDLQLVPYEHHSLSTAFTVRQLAAAEHIREGMVAETVIVKADGRFVMAELPVRQGRHNVFKESLGFA